MVQPALAPFSQPGVLSVMRNSLRLFMATALFAVAAACSRSSDQPALPDDLKQDLAKAGAGDVQLAGNPSQKLMVVSASEQTMGNAPSPKAPSTAKTASTHHGARAAVKSAPKTTPASATAPKSEQISPEQAPSPDVRTLPAPAPIHRPEDPRPSTQPEPRGGWKTPGQVIRNAPFPINP
jgi:hypothetical protein